MQTPTFLSARSPPTASAAASPASSAGASASTVSSSAGAEELAPVLSAAAYQHGCCKDGSCHDSNNFLEHFILLRIMLLVVRILRRYCSHCRFWPFIKTLNFLLSYSKILLYCAQQISNIFAYSWQFDESRNTVRPKSQKYSWQLEKFLIYLNIRCFDTMHIVDTAKENIECWN